MPPLRGSGSTSELAHTISEAGSSGSTRSRELHPLSFGGIGGTSLARDRNDRLRQRLGELNDAIALATGDRLSVQTGTRRINRARQSRLLAPPRTRRRGAWRALVRPFRAARRFFGRSTSNGSGARSRASIYDGELSPNSPRSLGAVTLTSISSSSDATILSLRPPRASALLE